MELEKKENHEIAGALYFTKKTKKALTDDWYAKRDNDIGKMKMLLTPSDEMK